VNANVVSPSGDDPGYIYGPDDYFAFVESIDPLSPSALRNGSTADHINVIVAERDSARLRLPGYAIWLDCVQSQYFMRLAWKNNRCEIDNPEQSALRRQQIRQLDRDCFKIAFLLLDRSSAAERGTYDEFARAAWHRIVLSDASGLPVLVAPDFDLDPDSRRIRHLRYLGRCSDLEQRGLANALSLDFLPTANLKGIERGSPNSPPLPPIRGRGGVEQQIELARREDLLVQHSVYAGGR